LKKVTALVATSKYMWAVELCSNEILQFSTVGVS